MLKNYKYNLKNFTKQEKCVMKTLFINACVREDSRTLVIARDFISKNNLEVEELVLENEKISPLDKELLKKRESLIREKKWDDPMLKYAKQLASADKIIIAAPYWDLSFPALLKVYIENVLVSGLTFDYSDGAPKSLCRARSLVYITTAGGRIFNDFGYSYVKAIAGAFWGVSDTVCYKAEELDALQIDAREVLEKAKITVIK